MAKERKSKKQRDLERQAARDDQRSQFEVECRSIKEASIELGLDSRFEFNVNECVETKLREWDAAQLQNPTGRYRDENKLRSDYQQAFTNYICSEFPYVIEELRELTSLFEQIWPENPELYIEIFDNFKCEPIFDLYNSFRSEVEFALNEDLPFSIFTLKNQFDRPDNPFAFKLDYKWGEYAPLLKILALNEESAQSLDLQTHKDDLVDWIVQRIDIAWILLQDRFEPKRIEQFARDRATNFVATLKVAENHRHFYSQAAEVLDKYLQQISSNELVVRSTFLTLQVSVLNWARKYNLEKDWLLRYAYHFLSQISSHKNIEVGELDVPALLTRSLWGDKFMFEFRGWWAGDESRENFEQQLRKQFEDQVTQYFHRTSRALSLENLKRLTRPPDMARANWMAIAAVLNLTTTDQLLNELADRCTDAEIDNLPDHSTLDFAARELREFGLPIIY